MLTPNLPTLRIRHSVFKRILRGLASALALALITSAPAAQTGKEVPVLQPGKPVERELAGDAAQTYLITLAAQQFLHVIVEQKGVDVVVALFAPDGKKVAEIDSPNGTQGPEPISFVTEAAGNYRLEVRSLDAGAEAGRYRASIEELRPARRQDKGRVAARNAAQQLSAEADQLRGEGSGDSLRKAIGKYQESLPLWRALNDRAKEAMTLNYIGFLHSSLGDKRKALEFYNQALPLRRAAGDRSGEAYTLNNLGAIYDVLGEQRKALGFYRRALPLWRAAGDRGGEANTLQNIGTVYNSLGEQWKALVFLDRALLLARAAGDRSGEAYTLNNLGAIYDVLGEKQKALDLYDRALPLWREVNDRGGEAETLNNIGSAYDALGETQRALDFYDQALRLKRAVGDRSGEANAVHNIGFAYNSLGEQKRALELYKQALLLWRGVGDRRNEAYTLNSIGIVHGSLGERREALDSYNQALTLARAVGDRRGEAYTLNNLGAVYDLAGETQKALVLYERALPLWRGAGDRAGEARTLYNIAKSARARGDLIGARARIEAALTIIESLRTKIGGQRQRASYFATTKDFYDLYVDLLMRSHKLRPSAGFDDLALQASERGRARGLLETLAEANADIRQGVDPTLVARERALQQQLSAKAYEQMRLLGGQHTAAQADSAAREIERLTAELEMIQARIRRTSPRYAALTQPRPLTAGEIRKQLLDRDTLLLEYALGDEKSYLWAVTPTAITSYELPKRAEIEDAARRFYASLVTRPSGPTDSTPSGRELGPSLRRQAGDKADEVASGLSRVLLGPVARQLGKKRLLIISDGVLQYIPFGALPAPPAGNTKGEGQPLVVLHEIVNLPSASTLAVLRRETRGRRPAPKALAVLADPVFENTDERITRSGGRTAGAAAPPDADGGRGLGLMLMKAVKESGVTGGTLRIPRLPGTRREAEMLADLIPAAQRRQALDFAASRRAAADPKLGEYRYVHFATHGFLNSQHPELSGLIFTLFDEEGRAQDGFLRAHEVFNLKLSADVVVLSACQTGLGKDVRGEGLVSLTRGFMYAGAPRVVVSLWNISDAATAELMGRFYRGMIVEKLRPAKALQAAQVSMLEDKKYASPFYWAAFTLQGEWR